VSRVFNCHGQVEYVTSNAHRTRTTGNARSGAMNARLVRQRAFWHTGTRIYQQNIDNRVFVAHTGRVIRNRPIGKFHAQRMCGNGRTDAGTL